MLSIISPSKTLDFNCRPFPRTSAPFFADQIRELLGHMRNLSQTDLEQLMKISPKLGKLNHERFQKFQLPFTPENSRQALLTFKGDVFKGIAVDDYGEEEFNFAQDHLRILSGLYGLLRPMDLIQPYRLEMGTRLSGAWGKNLYQFWENRITERINHEMEGTQGDRLLVNLASTEYFKAVRPRHLTSDLVNILFKEQKGAAFKTIGIHAKKARGLMVDFIIQNRIDNAGHLKDFERSGYVFSAKLSTQTDWVFIRG